MIDNMEVYATSWHGMTTQLQGVMLVALLILFPMTIQLLVHQDESPLWRTVYVEVEGEDEKIRSALNLEVEKMLLALQPSTSKSSVKPKWAKRMLFPNC